MANDGGCTDLLKKRAPTKKRKPELDEQSPKKTRGRYVQSTQKKIREDEIEHKEEEEMRYTWDSFRRKLVPSTQKVQAEEGEQKIPLAHQIESRRGKKEWDKYVEVLLGFDILLCMPQKLCLALYQVWSPTEAAEIRDKLHTYIATLPDDFILQKPKRYKKWADGLYIGVHKNKKKPIFFCVCDLEINNNPKTVHYHKQIIEWLKKQGILTTDLAPDDE